jgi:hypothetical protein
MNKNTVTFDIYLIDKNNEKTKDKEYIFNLNDKIIDIKNKILKNTFNDMYNNLEMTNITEKVYKDYGKLFFDKGLLPLTIDNYQLSEFTNEGRVFSFIVKGSNIDKKEKKKNIDKKEKNILLYDNDFPPLPKLKK